MFGIETIEVLGFARQLGLAIAGAAALWGAVFFFRSHHHPDDSHTCLIYEWIARRLFAVFVGGAVLTAGAWIALFSQLSASAHEGIRITATPAELLHALEVFSPIVVVWLLLTLVWMVGIKKRFFQKHLGLFYVVQFLFALALISFPVWEGALSRTQLFFIGHSAHSIFTVGTVLVLDYLFVISRHSTFLKQHIFPWFPTISKVIWAGLAVDFASVLLVFKDALALTPQFFFMQTVIGIIVINGVLLSGPITRRILASVEKEGEALTRKWTRIADISGVMSVVSWLSITFVDFLHQPTFSYASMIGLYLAAIVVVFGAHHLLGKIERARAPLHIS